MYVKLILYFLNASAHIYAWCYVFHIGGKMLYAYYLKWCGIPPSIHIIPNIATLCLSVEAEQVQGGEEGEQGQNEREGQEESESEYDDDELYDLIDDVIIEDAAHLASRPILGKTYIGSYSFAPTGRIEWWASVSSAVFFSYGWVELEYILADYRRDILSSLGGSASPNLIQLVPIHIDNSNVYTNATLATIYSRNTNMVVKTYWLRIIQRTWKRVYKERIHIIRMRCTPRILKYREYHARYPVGLNRIPGIRGLLAR